MGQATRNAPMTYPSHDAYFATVPKDVQARLAAIQEKVESLIPGASRCMGYNMPAFRDKRIFFYFAAFKSHIGVYPPVQDPDLAAELARYSGPKGNLQFPLNEPMPYALIARVARSLAQQYATVAKYPDKHKVSPDHEQ